MTDPDMSSATSARVGMIKALALLAIGLLPWPSDWDKVRDVIDSARSPELNRTERDGHSVGYYEGLIGGRDSIDSSRSDAALRFIGSPAGCVAFKDADVVHYRDGEFLQFELLPLVERTLFGQPFSTNEHGMHDGPVSLQKVEGAFRVAVLGSSIDMGWGVSFHDTYIKQFEAWLNAHSARLGIAPSRRFEVLNFGVAAYSPMQRLESLRTKVMAFHPDLVIFSASTNDIRFLEIHLCDMLRKKIDLKYDFLRKIVRTAGIDDDDARVDARGDLVNKTRLKRKLQPYYWNLYDVPVLRAQPVARLKALASHQGVPVFDLSDSFDQFDPTQIEIAAGDDHPNALGHRRLFRSLARAVVKDDDLYRLLFTEKGEATVGHAGTREAAPPDTGSEGNRRDQGVPPHASKEATGVEGISGSQTR
jgi:lysophospholipase L1-like esterase